MFHGKTNWHNVLFDVLQFIFGAKSLFMDAGNQNNHIKAYGIAIGTSNDIEVEWLLNYRGGSFNGPLQYDEEELIIRGVSFEKIANVKLKPLKMGFLIRSEPGSSCLAQSS